MANPEEKVTEKFFNKITSKVMELTQGIVHVEDQWRMPQVLITGNDNKEKAIEIIQKLNAEAEEIKKNLIDIRSIRKKRNEELREKIKNVKEITLKSSMELDEQVSLLAKHRLDYKRKSKRASSLSNGGVSEGLENSLITSAEMEIASFNGDVTDDMLDAVSSTPFIIRKKH